MDSFRERKQIATQLLLDMRNQLALHSREMLNFCANEEFSTRMKLMGRYGAYPIHVTNLDNAYTVVDSLIKKGTLECVDNESALESALITLQHCSTILTSANKFHGETIQQLQLLLDLEVDSAKSNRSKFQSSSGWSS